MKRIKLALISIFSGIYFTAFGAVQFTGLSCNYQAVPSSVSTQEPVFSWKIQSDKQDVVQTAYQIELYSGKQKLRDSGKIRSAQSHAVTLKGTALKSDNTYQWRVKVWNNKGEVSGWSNWATFHTALFSPSEWKAQFIGASQNSDSPHTDRCPAFRKEFSVSKKIKQATLFCSALGLYKAFINGKPVTDALFTPGWTSYHNRLQYQAYDVTSLLGQQTNVLGAIVGKGWYSGILSWHAYRNFYGNENALIMQLQIQYTDSTQTTIASGTDWKTAECAIRYSDIYNGECVDARVDNQWMFAGFDDSQWKPSVAVNYPMEKLTAQKGAYVRKHEPLAPKTITKKPNGSYLIDFGQNFSGIIRFRLQGKSGDTVRIRHAEVLDKQGELYITNLRKARQQNVYILSGKVDVFEPTFTFQGFRYATVEGYTGELKTEDVQASALYSEMKTTGSFACSESLVNQLQHNIQWGQKSNFLDIPTDCPQRDERLGWTGDAQVFGRTAMFNADVYSFFSKWLIDLKLEQKEDGAVPFYVPRLKTPTEYSAAGWADAATIIPSDLFQVYGDTAILKQQYESMKGWVNYMKNKSVNYLWNTNWHYGDWLFYSPADDLYGDAAITNKHFIAQCFFAHSTQLLINAATILGKTEDVKIYSSLLENIKKAFLYEYVTQGGRFISETQTAYTLALQFDMVPESMRPLIANRLVENIQYYNNHLTTGFLGTPYLMHVLTKFGKTETAYKLLFQKSYPSWLYPVTKGATTIWERWDGIKPDGSFQNPGMNSFNHYAYGAIGDWLYRVVAGINEDAPGYKKILLKPIPGGNLKFAKASFESIYGTIISDWKIQNGLFCYSVQIPANSTAVVEFPYNQPVIETTISGKELKNYPAGSKIEKGSGKYYFIVKL